MNIDYVGLDKIENNLGIRFDIAGNTTVMCLFIKAVLYY